MASIPNMFFNDGKLYRKRRIVKSDNTLRAWCYQDEEYVALHLPYLRRSYTNAYTLAQAAKLMRTTKGRLIELIRKGLIKAPEYAYDFINGSYDLQQSYIDQADMLDVRQAVWDSLPKNRFGEPYRDTLINAEELQFRMSTGDDREFVQHDDGTIVKIYQA